MPLGCRNVEPVFLGAHQVSLETEEDRKNVLSTVANNAIVGALLQLSSLVRHADDLFCDISDECQKVFERTDKLNARINQLEGSIWNLDAKQVPVPEGDLKQFTTITAHHEARHGYDCALFQPLYRPQCVQDQYALCATNPTCVIRSADLYRKDGLSGSKMFKCWPVMLNDRAVRTPDLSLPRRIQRVRSFDKKYKQLKIRERPKTIHGFDDFHLDEIKKKEGEEETECLMVTDPPIVVSIDTSGSNFERMQSLRFSGRRYQSKADREKKKRRRRTVSGVPENIMSEIEKFDRRQKGSDGGPRHTPRSYSFDDLDAEDDIPRDEGMLKYLDEIDGRMEERQGAEKADKLMKYFPCRRSRSLPRCMKLTAATARSLSADRKSNRDLNTTYTSSSLSLSSMASTASSRLSRAARRSTLLSCKLKSLVSNKDKQRPKSLDVDMILDGKDSKRAINEKERSKSTYSLERNHAQRVPDSLLSQEYSQRSDSTIGPGSYYNFQSSTLPRAQAKKYDFPWESLPKDWTTSVKLREISKRRAKEDRQSSSGNWSQSGTSSNRHSLDSDLRSEGFKFNSQYSLGKDSGRDSLTLEEIDSVTDGTSTAGYAGDGTSTITGDTVSIGNPKTDFEQQETEAWIRSLAIRAAKQEQTSNHEKCSTLSRLTRQNILALDLMMSDDKSRKRTDEESSVYSVDQEGFYTSFHNDSGLKKSTNTLVDEDDISPTKDSVSVCSVDSVIHRPVRNDKFAGIRKGNASGPSRVISQVVPPSTPSLEGPGSNESDKSSSTQSTPELHSFPSQESSLSESSDPDTTFARIHEKTHLLSTGFPSLTALSTSDDETSPDSASEKLRKLSKITCDKYIFNESESDLCLSDIGETSGFSFLSHPPGSFFGTSKSEFTLSESSLKHSKSAVECSEKGLDSQALQQETLCASAAVVDKSKVGYQSWPRALKSTPTSGILKTPEKQFESGLRPQKTLNFAPMVNLFNHGEGNSVQLPLPSPTNSSSSEGTINLPHSSFVPSGPQDHSYKLSVPIDNNKSVGTFKSSKSQVNGSTNSNIPIKYQPTITVTPRSRSRSGERQRLGKTSQGSSIYASSNVAPNAQSTPQALSSSSVAPSSHHTSPNLYAVSPVQAVKGQGRSPQVSNTYGNHGYMDMQSVGRLRSAESASSLASSSCLDFQDGSTYMSMSSPSSSPNLSNMDFSMSSTPSGSMDSLQDLRKTPTNELDSDTYRVNTNLLTSRQNSKGSTGSLSDGRSSRSHGIQNGRTGEQKSFRLKETSNSNMNNSDVSFSSYKSTSSRGSLNSTDNDLTRITQMSSPSSSYMSSPHNPQMNSNSKAPKQMGRQSRADTRKESSYRNQNNRHSLPTAMSGSHGYTQNAPLNDRSRTPKQNTPPSQKIMPPSQKAMPSSKSCPSGFNSQNMPVRASQNTNRHSSYSPAVKAQADASQISTRTDSYRTATSSTRINSYRGPMHSSKSFPNLPPTKQSGPYRVALDMSPNRAFNNADDDDDDVMSRADSYRMAVRNTNGIVPDFANRNSSYRVAVNDDIPNSVNSKLDALSMDTSKTSAGRDVRRMGITDVDQAKDVSMRQAVKETKPSKPQQNGSGRIRKVTKQDVDPIEIVQTVDYRGDSRKANKNKENRSSTYIQFDPIFEDTEDFSMGLSPDGDLSSRDYSLHLSNTSKSKYSLINGTVKDANSNNIKGLQKSKSTKSIDSTNSSGSGKSVDMEDSWRFSQV